MRFLVVDDEQMALEYLVELLEEASPGCEIRSTTNPEYALAYAKTEDYDVIFLDIQMERYSGIDLANELKALKPTTNFIFTTGYNEYMGDAFDVDASAYLMKPISVDKIVHALENLRYTTVPERESSEEKRVVFHCFGNFEVLVDRQPVQFKLQKTREVLAYLVHRQGASCNNKEIMAEIWEDEGHESYFRKIRKDLVDTLKTVNASNILFLSRGYMGLKNLDDIDCDYFKWLQGDPSGLIAYQGEYMAQYSWGEYVNAVLASESEKYNA